MVHVTRWHRVLVTTIVVCLGACDPDESIREHFVPKEISSPTPTASSGLRWTLPDGWRRQGGSRPMRLATLEAGPPDRMIEVSVSQLGGDGGGLLANVNRWRGQIGLDPIKESELLRLVTAMTIGDTTVQLVDVGADVEDAERAMFVAIFPQAQRTLFFKLTADRHLVEEHREGFLELIKSVRFDVDAGDLDPLIQSPPGSLAVGGSGEPVGPDRALAADETSRGLPPSSAATGEKPVDWELPANWQVEDVSGRSMRLASFAVDGHPSLVTVTRFSGQVGGLLPNINRWRGQVGLSPVKDVNQQTMRSMLIGGAKGRLLEFDGTSSTGEQLIVAMVSNGGSTWFFKMKGSGELVGKHRSSFDRFIRSLRFGRPTGA